MEKLQIILAEIALCAQNARASHWTLRGSHYRSWHLQFGEMYDQLSEHADRIAEIIIQLGSTPPLSYEQYAQIAPITAISSPQDYESYLLKAQSDLEKLVDDINIYCAGDTDEITKSEVSAIGGEIRKLLMFVRQTIE